MCGLAGVIIKKEDRSQKDLSSVVSGFKRMLLSANSRGGHATGYALIDKYGGHTIIKRPLNAHKFLRDEISKEALNIVSEDITCILGHTRYATLGSPSKNRNNHPIRTGNTIGTHNGSIHNHKYLFNKYNMDRHAEVDSEAIFRLYETSKSAKDFSENRLPTVRGRVAIVWSDLEYPEYVYMIKGNNPLEMFYIPSLNIYAYGSTKNIIKSSGWLKYEQIDIKPNTMLRINTKTLNIRTKKITHKEPLPKKNVYYDDSIGAYTDFNYKKTVKQFVPRFSFKDNLRQQEQLFEQIAPDGTNIRKIKL